MTSALEGCWNLSIKPKAIPAAVLIGSNGWWPVPTAKPSMPQTRPSNNSRLDNSPTPLSVPHEDVLSSKTGMADITSVVNESRFHILLVEPKLDSTQTLQLAIEQKTHWSVVVAESPQNASKVASCLQSHLKLVLLTINRDYNWALNLIRDIKKTFSTRRLHVPSILVLSECSLPPEVAAAFERLGADYLLRAYPEQILATVTKLHWQLRRRKFPFTIVVKRHHGCVSQLIVKSGRVEIRPEIGPRLLILVEYMALHSRLPHTTQMIADTLGICRQSVKEYLHRIRRAIGPSGTQIFWTKRLAGGFVHGVSANCEFEDVEDTLYNQHL